MWGKKREKKGEEIPVSAVLCGKCELNGTNRDEKKGGRKGLDGRFIRYREELVGAAPTQPTPETKKRRKQKKWHQGKEERFKLRFIVAPPRQTVCLLGGRGLSLKKGDQSRGSDARQKDFWGEGKSKKKERSTHCFRGEKKEERVCYRRVEKGRGERGGGRRISCQRTKEEEGKAHV